MGRGALAASLGGADAHGDRVDAVVRSARYLRADAADPVDLRRLLGACHGELVVFFALPPAVTMRACRTLRDIGLPDGTRLVLEKPFGRDAASAAALNELLQQAGAGGPGAPRRSLFRHVPRPEHHGVRFANRFLESVLHSNSLAEVDIVFDEALGLEGRAGYYDGAGAAGRHDSESRPAGVVAAGAMEPPSTLSARDFGDAMAQVLPATRVWDDDPIAHSRQARYTAGAVQGRQLPSYVDEPGVEAGRGTETFAEVVLAVNTWRWAGVPFRVRAGKALAATRKEAVITLKPSPWVPTGLSGYEQPDRVRIGFDPDRLDLDLNVNGPRDPAVLDRTTLSVSPGAGSLPAYGQVLEGVFAGDPTLSVRGDMVVECWRIVEPVLAAWRNGKVPLGDYPAGSAGP